MISIVIAGQQCVGVSKISISAYTCRAASVSMMNRFLPQVAEQAVAGFRYIEEGHAQPAAVSPAVWPLKVRQFIRIRRAASSTAQHSAYLHSKQRDCGPLLPVFGLYTVWPYLPSAHLALMTWHDIWLTAYHGSWSTAWPVLCSVLAHALKTGRNQGSHDMTGSCESLKHG